MPAGRVRLVIWCEDRHQEQFLRNLFMSPRFGLHHRDIRANVAPRGVGSGAQWVIENFHRAVQIARVEKHQQRLGVLVMLDGDNEGVAGRKRALLAPPHDKRDDLRLAIWVPTRNVETWVKYLADLPPAVASHLLETTDFKQEVARQWRDALSVAISRWPSDSASDLPSLSDACTELRRLPFG